MFFEVTNTQLIQDTASLKSCQFAVQDIEFLFVMSENVLRTHFFELFSRVVMAEYENDGIISIDLIQDSDEFGNLAESLLQNSQFYHETLNSTKSLFPGTAFEEVFIYLLNLRKIAVILTNIFWNQLRILIRQRVDYDRETFNYEEYRQRGMSDGRLLKNFLFMPAASRGTRKIVTDFFKFQQKEDVYFHLDGCDLLLNTSDKIKANLGMFCMHISNLKKLDQVIDIEPMLLVLLHKMSNKKISKDILSIVGRQFFKDLKQKYRLLPNYSTLVIHVIKVFESQGDIMLSSLHAYSPTNLNSSAHIAHSADTDMLINQSFMQFMVMVCCSSLVDEHNRFIQTITKKTNFLIQENMDKFKKELLHFNSFQSILAHLEFDHSKF